MSVIVSSTADCQNIVVRVLANSYGLGGVQPNAEPLQIKVSQLDSFFEYTVSNTSSDVVTIVTPSQVGGASHGVFMVEVFQAGNVVGKAATLLACDILCCIASKMEELLDCDCDCNKCSEHFVEAQKIFTKYLNRPLGTFSWSIFNALSLIWKDSKKFKIFLANRKKKILVDKCFRAFSFHAFK